MGDIIDIGCANATGQIIAIRGRIIEIVSSGDIVERRRLLLRVKQAVQGGICIAHGGFTL